MTRTAWTSAAAAVALGLAALAGASPARAQDYPSQDIRFICGFPAGSGADVLVRYFAEKLRPIAGRTVIVENKVGAAGNIAAEFTARAKPDGHTVHVHAGCAVAANQHLFKRRPFDAVKDLQVVATLNQQPFMVMVPANSPYKTLAELTEAMKQKGDKASYAQSNTTGKVMGELYKQATGITAVEVPYRTANDSLNDFASGRLDYGMMDPVFALSAGARGPPAHARGLDAAAHAGGARAADHDRSRHARRRDDGLVRRHGAVGDAAAGGRQAEQVVQRDRWPPRRPRSSSTSSAAIPTSARRSEGQARWRRTSRTGSSYVKIAKIEPQ